VPEARPAPYPADTRAKGWRFELNMEQVKKSDTWLRARTGRVRASLLLLWAEAWEQTPCGSLPDDDELLCLLLDMEPDEFATMRAVLMRGWWRGDDGRLYHDTITDRVLDMLKSRAANAKRVAGHRAKQSDGGSSNALHEHHQQGESLGSYSTRTSTGSKEEEQKTARKRAIPPPIRPDSVSEQVWVDWLALRKAKRAPVTATVVEDATIEAAKAGMGLDAFLRVWCRRGSQGLEADWLKPHERGTTAFDAKAAEAAKWTRGTSLDRSTQQDYIDAAAPAIR